MRRIRSEFQTLEAERFQKKLESHTEEYDDTRHLEACIDWFKTAQDATPDDGVSRGYSLVGTSKFSKGWQPSYPETTGYIVPTLLKAQTVLGDNTLSKRAKKMVDWEIDILTPEGGTPGGYYRPDSPPAIFDTGQVIRGFWAYYEFSLDTKYLDYAKKSADFMVKHEDSNGGVWTNFNAVCVNNDSTTYNIYAASPLAELGKGIGEQRYLDLADRVAAYTLNQMNEYGWIKGADFSLSNDALLHTMGYTIDGLYDIGVCLDNDTYKKAAIKALDAVLKHVQEDGFVSGRFDTQFNPSVTWACLTGSCQVAETAMKVFRDTEDTQYKVHATLIKDYIKPRQNMVDPRYGIGAVWGSWPLNGGYQSYQSINWAVKYFADLLIYLKA